MEQWREQTLGIIAEIQSRFPPALLAGLWFNAITPTDLDDLLATALSIFSPVFLPLFERDGDLWAVHVRPGVPWEEGAWVMLPHDAAEPQWVASRLSYLPAGLLIPPHTPPRNLDAVWDALAAFSERVPEAVRPAKKLFIGSPGPDPDVRMTVDPHDGAARAAAFTGQGTDDEVRTAAEAMLVAMPSDPYVLTTVAFVRAARQYANPVAPAVAALRQEVPLGLRYPGYLFQAGSAPELLEVARTLAVPGLSEADPLSPLRTNTYSDPRTAVVLRHIAQQYRDRGDDLLALNQLRNGAAVAAWSQSLDADWCQALAEQADRVEPGCVAAALAGLAANVIDRGP
jgi:hypothetical protein